ncbi:GIY-YIG nuclease family protein [Flavobacterium sp.]|uniref:GIY-YIG nuclease family protein n=1 Tax=Flavobacterium sp. TaxID=239 RepID=UPI0035278490
MCVFFVFRFSEITLFEKIGGCFKYFIFYVYILHSLGFDKYYIGQTNAIQNRLNHHNSACNKVF